jgi:L-alanine-DL-glutamate epimerase-like enolase superfamily enzyme
MAERDVTVVKDEFMSDLKGLVSSEAIELHVIKAGHEVGITRGREVASIARRYWNRPL